MMCVGGKNQVIMLAVLGEVCLSVINHVVRADRSCRLNIPRTAHRGNFSPERFGNLDRKGADPARGAIYQDSLAWLDLSFVTKALKGSDCRHGYGCRVLKRNVGRL